jgi:hypothetical protein
MAGLEGNMASELSIQDVVVSTLTEMGISTASLLHTVLLKDGCFVGHKFRFAGGDAVGLPEANLLQFFAEDGKLLKTVAIKADNKEAA